MTGNASVNYIATWFYKESGDEAGFYPQIGKFGSSKYAHSVYMRLLVPFFTTFRHYNPVCRLLFFTNATVLPAFLRKLFTLTDVEVITLSYTCAPPQGWHRAWRNQFYVYDILRYMGGVTRPNDTFLLCDADCLCFQPLTGLFGTVVRYGSALYLLATNPEDTINGISLKEMNHLYTCCYMEPPTTPLGYYGGEFIALRGDTIVRLNEAFVPLWEYNMGLFKRNLPKLNEEALFLSVLAERLGIRNDIGNAYIKRMWTAPRYNNVQQGDERFAIWHLPYEKKRGLAYLCVLLRRHPDLVRNERLFRRKVSFYTGVPKVTFAKKAMDKVNALIRF